MMAQGREASLTGQRDGAILAGKRVLIVEDEMIVAITLEDMLDGLGLSLVGTAGALASGLAMAAEAALDLAILDINLRGRPGYPIATVLRQRGIPFAFASGYGTVTDPSFDGVPLIQKPYTQD